MSEKLNRQNKLRDKNLFENIITYLQKNRFLKIIIGTGLFAFSVKCVYDPCGLVIGGFSGIAIIIRKLTENLVAGGIPLGITTFVLNIPIFIIALKQIGKKFVMRSIAATFIVSVWLMLLPEYSMTGKDYMLTAIAGGIFGGGGLGLVLSTGTTTGGSDMLATLLQKKYPHYSIAVIMVIIDAIIVFSSISLFGIESAIYAVVSLFIQAKISDALVLGVHFAKSVYIITESPYEVAEEVMEQLKRGITSINVKGMYTGDNKNMLFCVVSKKEIAKLKNIVNRHDGQAFVIVSDVKEVLGEGF